MSRRILVVDDEPHIVSSLKDIFALEGWESDAAHTGREAVDAMARERCDAVVMDLRMPELNGLETIDHLRSIDPELPIILMTAFSRDEIIRHAVKEGSMTIEADRGPAEVAEQMADLDGAAIVAHPERVFLDRIALIRRAEDADVRRTRSPAVALRLLQSGGPMSILLECALPRRGGKTVPYLIGRPTPTVTVFLARLAEDDAGRRAVLKGSPVRAFLSKPFHPGQLIAELREILPDQSD